MITPYIAPATLHHGGGLLEAAKHSNIPLTQWIDLSTGINPNGWPVPEVPASLWQRLPEENDGLEQAAAQYYSQPPENFMITAGSQSIIQLLPKVIPKGTVWVPSEGYAEHPYWWDFSNHDVFFYQQEDLDALLDAGNALTMLPFDTLLIINPNNPTTVTHPKQILEDLLSLVSRHNKRLIIDEAFLDTQPEQSMIEHCKSPHIAVFRSLGKFFGLAGIRCGFLFTHVNLIDELRKWTGPWAVANPSRWIAKHALLDKHWHIDTTNKLKSESQRLHTLMTTLISDSDIKRCDASDYFCSIVFTSNNAMKNVKQQLANRAILTREFTTENRLRIGLPGNEQQWQHLEHALA